jgi:hypothetical protein
MWRNGPVNYTFLCNSCGVKWRRGKILATGIHRHPLLKPNQQHSKNDRISCFSSLISSIPKHKLIKVVELLTKDQPEYKMALARGEPVELDVAHITKETWTAILEIN